MKFIACAINKVGTPGVPVRVSAAASVGAVAFGNVCPRQTAPLGR